MKAMIVISYVLCGIGLLGSLVMFVENDPAAIFSAALFGFFLALTIMKNKQK